MWGTKATWGIQCHVNRMFSGLVSRWMIPRVWRYCIDKEGGGVKVCAGFFGAEGIEWLGV